MWYSPEPDVISSAGTVSGREEIKQKKGEAVKMQGRFKGSSHEWEQGIVSKEVRQAAAAPGTHLRWNGILCAAQRLQVKILVF